MSALRTNLLERMSDLSRFATNTGDYVDIEAVLDEIHMAIPKGAVLVTGEDMLQMRALLTVALDVEPDASPETWKEFRRSRNRVGRAILARLREMP